MKAMKLKAKIDWDTVELVGALVPASPPVVFSAPVERPLRPQLFHDRRGRSIVKKILSGAAAKARARGALYTHTQLRSLLSPGLETFIYSWWLVAAAIESDRDLSRAVDVVAHAITATSHRVEEALKYMTAHPAVQR